MATVILRLTKGAELTFQEADDNFNNLNTGKVEKPGDVMTGPLQVPVGTAALPGLAVGAANIGLFRRAIDDLAVSAGGVEIISFNGSAGSGDTRVEFTPGGSGAAPQIKSQGIALNIGLIYDLKGGTGVSHVFEAGSTKILEMDLSGLLLADKLVARPEIKDYSITRTAPASSSGAITFDYALGQAFDVTLTENITSITISNPPASGNYGEIVIAFVQDGTGGWTVAGWPAAVKWPGGTAPTITTTATTGSDDITLRTSDGGTKWRGDFSQDYS